MSTCEDLNIRLKWHVSNKTSQEYKNRRYIPKIEFIVKAPSKDRKTLEKVENEWIHEYATKYGDKLLNIKPNPNLKRKEVKFKVSMRGKCLTARKILPLRDLLTKLNPIQTGGGAFRTPPPAKS